MSAKLSTLVKPGVVSGNDLKQIFDNARKSHYALPAVNVVGTNSINGVLEAAKLVNSPVIIQLSNGGAHFYAGKSLNNDQEKRRFKEQLLLPSMFTKSQNYMVYR